MQVPLLDLRLQYASIREDVLSAVTRVCDSQQFILGSEVEQLESEIAAAIEVPYAIAVSSRTDALLVARAGLADRVRLPVEPAARTHVYHQLVIRVPERDVVRAHLASRVGTEVYYPVPFHRQPCFTHLGYSCEAVPNADTAAREVLALPIYPELTSDQEQDVIDSLAECVA
jgi:dTDP-4-amino-4,6-dideoxygalactose transaminase